MQMKSLFSGDTNIDELHCRSGPGPLISVNADSRLIIRDFLAVRGCYKEVRSAAMLDGIGSSTLGRRAILDDGANLAC